MYFLKKEVKNWTKIVRVMRYFLNRVVSSGPWGLAIFKINIYFSMFQLEPLYLTCVNYKILAR
jgi:hypothetical protein